MRVRKTKNVSLDEIQLHVAKGAILHPDLHQALLQDLEEQERKGKLSRVPATILECHHVNMSQRVAIFEESCLRRNIILEAYLK